jgi:hypothetical protein
MASEIFKEQVLDPAEAAPTGIERLQVLSERFLGHVEEGVFPGGCFFASVLAEMDTHPGPVRDRALQTIEDWTARLVQAVMDAQAEDAVDPDEDPEQLAFEIDAYLLLANAMFVMLQAPEPLDRARRAIDCRLNFSSRPVAPARPAAL